MYSNHKPFGEKKDSDLLFFTQKSNPSHISSIKAYHKTAPQKKQIAQILRLFYKTTKFDKPFSLFTESL